MSEIPLYKCAYVVATNWATLASRLEIEGCSQALHIPLFDLEKGSDSEPWSRMATNMVIGWVRSRRSFITSPLWAP